MNILPKKSWHVRTKKNIERVRRDEAEAAAKEKELQKRAQIANLEASLDVLRKKKRDVDDEVEPAKDSTASVDIVNPSGSSGAGHLNLFREIEQAEGKVHGSNLEAAAEEKKEAEDWEKKVGILQYLGQSHEDPKRFYQTIDRTAESSLTVKQQRDKDAHDPILGFAWSKKHKIQSSQGSSSQPAERRIEFESASSSKQSKKGHKRSRHQSVSSSSSENEEGSRRRRKRKKAKKSKRRKTPSSESDPESEEERKHRKKANLDLLRKQRLEREETERKRTEELLNRIAGRSNDAQPKEEESSDRNRRYNSQYNPHLAKY